MKNELAVIIKESGLEQTKAQVLLDNFTGYFEIASEWEKKASVIVVTDASQKAEMQMARAGRLFLREKRIEIEKTRKKLKEQSLREGKAIDGFANVLKAGIVHIEEYLGKQEKFVEIKAAEIAELARVEMERKAEEDRLAKEEAERKKQERIQLENEELKKESIAIEAKRKELEKQTIIEREEAEVERILLEEKAKAEREEAETKRIAIEKKAEKEKREIENNARREMANYVRKAKQKEADQEQKAIKKAMEAEKEQQARLDKQVQCPFCKKLFVPERLR